MLATGGRGQDANLESFRVCVLGVGEEWPGNNKEEPEDRLTPCGSYAPGHGSESGSHREARREM